MAEPAENPSGTPPPPRHGFTDWSGTAGTGSTLPPQVFPPDSPGFKQDWSKGFAEARSSAPPPPPRPVGTYELRPLSTGEVLDRTFSLYRRHFWLFAGIAAISAGIAVIGQMARFSAVGWQPFGKFGNIPKETVVSGSIGFVMALVYFAVWSFTQAATVSAVSAVYLGHRTSIGQAVRSARSHWFRYVLIALWQFWSVLWVPLLFIVPAVLLAVLIKTTGVYVIAGLMAVIASLSLIYGLIAYIRNSLAIAASVSENLKVRAAMRRSKVLVAGSKGRIFLLLLLLYVLSLVGGGAQVPLAFLLIKSHAGERIAVEGLTLILGFVISALIGPVGSIALCLFYVDERVRKEGYDIENLMEQSFLGTPTEISAGLPASEPL